MTNPDITSTITDHFQSKGLSVNSYGRRVEVAMPDANDERPWTCCVGIYELLAARNNAPGFTNLSEKEVTTGQEFLVHTRKDGDICVAFYHPVQERMLRSDTTRADLKTSLALIDRETVIAECNYYDSLRRTG